MKIIISLTSYPPRIQGVHKVIESLYMQTVPADEIVLYLSEEEFPNLGADIPDTLQKRIGQQGFHIKWVKGNLKSHKKYYYALREYRDDVVITVDDDTIYAQSMVSELVAGWKRFPEAISARNARIILKKGERLEEYGRWDTHLDEYVHVPRMDLCAIGAGGICYGPKCAGRGWFEKKIFMETAENQDDLWLKYNEIIQNIPVVYVQPSQKDGKIEHSQDDCLTVRNVHHHGNDHCIERMAAMMKTHYRKQYEVWHDNLMEREEYIARKKLFHHNIIKKPMEQAGDIPIYFYGAGKNAEFLLNVLSDLRLTGRIKCVIVSDLTGNPSEIAGLEVRPLCEIDKSGKVGILFGVNEKNQREIENSLKEYDYQCIRLDMQKLMRYVQIRQSWRGKNSVPD